MTMPAGRHTLVVGAALQQDRFASRELPRFDYVFTVPAVFAQDDVTLGSRVAISASARVDVHSAYGTLVEPARLGAGQALGGVDGAPVDRRRRVRADAVHRGDRRQRPLAAGAADRTRGGAGPHGLGRRDAGRAARSRSPATGFGSIVDDAVQLASLPQLAVAGARGYAVGLVNAPEPVRTYGTEFLARYRRGRLGLMATHAFTHATELDVDTGRRREVPLTPRHAASLNAAWEAGWGRAGVEAYYTGRQSLEDDPVSRGQPPLRALRRPRRAARRPPPPVPQRREPRRRPPDEDRAAGAAAAPPDGRWTVDAWAPLDGRTWNGGFRVAF